MTIEVRPAERADADAIAIAHLQGWREGYRHVFPDELLDDPRFAARRLDTWRGWTWNASGTTALYVAVRDGRVVGFGHCGPERLVPECDQSAAGVSAPAAPSRGEVYGFYVHPSAWGSEAAARLMDRCIGHLRAEGYDDAVLWVLDDNPRARRFYEREGWRPTGRSTTFEIPATWLLDDMAPIGVPEVEYHRRL